MKFKLKIDGTVYICDMIYTDIDECESSPCFRGNCTDQVNGYICECTPGYSGHRCDAGKLIIINFN